MISKALDTILESPECSEQHARFLRRLKRSSDAVFKVARWLHDRGRIVEIPTIQFSPTTTAAPNFFDDGDLFSIDPKTGDRRRIEVKHRSTIFTGAADWPFKDVFVSSVKSVERALGGVAAYVTVSHDLRAIAVITHETSSAWYIVEEVASNTNNKERYYACPLGLVRFYRLTNGGDDGRC